MDGGGRGESTACGGGWGRRRVRERGAMGERGGSGQAVERRAARRSALRAAHHEAMDCLGQMVWESQRAGRTPDGAAYIDCVQRHATRD